MKTQRTLLLVLAFLLAWTTSCAKRANEVIGRWAKHTQLEYGSTYLEFFKDGVFTAETNGQRAAGSWSALDDGRIRVTASAGMLGSVAAFAKVAGDEMTVDDGSGENEVFVRDPSKRADEIKLSVQKAAAERKAKVETEKRVSAEREAAEEEKRQKELAAERQQLQLNQDAKAKNELAWVMATSSKPEKRDGPKALALATEISTLFPQNDVFLDTLAAAYARNGEFDKAVETQKRALAINSSGFRYTRRLALYEKRQAYEE